MLKNSNLQTFLNFNHDIQDRDCDYHHEKILNQPPFLNKVYSSVYNIHEYNISIIIYLIFIVLKFALEV